MRPWSRLFGVRVPRPSTRSHCVARGDRRGVASLCLGGGEAVALAVELA